jgi:hypothetical protein
MRATTILAIVLSAPAALAGGGLSVSEQARLDPNGGTPTRFGHALGISGDLCVVGDPWLSMGQGRAYVYVRSGSSWTFEAEFLPPTPKTFEMFAEAVAVDGDRIVIGVPLEKAFGTFPGAAYVYVRSGTTWAQEAQLFSSVPMANDEFGYAVTISGDTIAVGAWGEDHTNQNDAGAVYVFVWNGATWIEQARLVGIGSLDNDYFGRALDLDGDTLLVGESRDDTPAGTRAGSASVFVRTGTVWNLQQKLTASDAQMEDRFGRSVALHGDTVVVGAPQEDGPGSNSGAAYVFTRAGTVWTEEAKLAPTKHSAGDRFGRDVEVDGATVAVGAPDVAHSGFAEAGTMYFFARAGTTWTQRGESTSSTPSSGSFYGQSVAIDGATLAVGSPADGGPGLGVDEGAVFLYGMSYGPAAYCTAGSTASGCTSSISATGTPSAGSPSGFDLTVTDVEGNKRGLFFWGANGRQANSWGNGTSFQCVVPPVRRGLLLQSVGTQGFCDASYDYDLNARWTQKPGSSPGAGACVQSQFWHRDPFNTSNQKTSLSNAIEFLVGP